MHVEECQNPHVRYLTHRCQMQGLREAVLARRRKYSEKFYGERSSIWLEHKIVDLGVAGSIPVAHPISSPPLGNGAAAVKSTADCPICGLIKARKWSQEARRADVGLP